MSTQPCGCDPESKWVCDTHKNGFIQTSKEQRIIHRTSLPTETKDRKFCPIASGVLDYFPDALAEVARVSHIGNEQHNPGQPLHWDRSKSADEGDALIRHFLDRGTRDTDGARHSAKVAWRALALLQKEIEQEKV